MSQAQPLPRWFLALSAITAIAVILALYVLIQQRQVSEPPFTPRLLFPALESALDRVTTLNIVTEENDFTVVKSDRGWALPGKANYPANLNRIAQTLHGLAAMQVIDAKTKNPARHKALGLGDPLEGGNGTALSLSNSEGKTIASLIFGNAPQNQGAKHLYVRLPGGPQTWITETSLEVFAEEADWLDRDVINVSNGDIAAATIRPAKGTEYTLSRASAEVGNFTLENIPKGRTAKAPFTWNPTALGLAGLPISDVKPLETLSENATEVIITLFDGLTTTFALWPEEGGYWLALTNAQAGPDGAAQERVEALTERAEGWAFEIPQYKFEQMTKKRDDLLEPLEPPETP